MSDAAGGTGSTGTTGTTQTTGEGAGTGTTQAPAQQAQAQTSTQQSQQAADSILGGATSQGQEGATTEPGTTPATQVADIEIKVPDGVEVDAATMDRFKPLAKEMKLDSAGAQKLVDLYIDSQTNFSKKAEAAWTATKEQWREAVSKDTEIGGAKFEETVRVARQAIEKFGGQALKQALNDLGIGNHPEIVRFAYKVGKAISEDSIGGTTGAPPQQNSEEAAYRAAFPSMFPKQK